MPDEEKKLLQKMEAELRAIRNAVDESWMRLIVSGAWRGAGFVLGTVLALALLGWLLSIFGVIPGLREIAEYLQTIVESRQTL